MNFGADYLIPKPFDPRLSGIVSSAVAQAAMDSGVAKRPIEDIEAYRETLDHAVFKSAMLMRPVFDAASKQSKALLVLAALVGAGLAALGFWALAG